ncbi:sensor histidine kinase [Sphingobacterium siyangense]|uniref:sensor histidine kinase n=1 Tax=Sphingobacterium siyangense TaxID=459529 RepID=UPI003017964C
MDFEGVWGNIKVHHRNWIFQSILLVLVFFIFVWGYSEAIGDESLFLLFVAKDYFVFLLCFYFLPKRLIKSKSSAIKLASIVAFWFFLFYFVWCFLTYATSFLFEKFATNYNEHFNRFLNVILKGNPAITLLDFVRFGPDYMGIFILALGPQWIRLAIEDHLENYRLQKENLNLELDFLKSQINPHFLFNTLNNIYLLLEFDPIKGKEMILRLTGLMRYNVFESKNETIQLYKELIYIDDFLSLMRIRYGKQVTIKSSIGKVTDDLEIIPLLIISFVENAFKHGPDKDPANDYISVDIQVADQLLKVNIVNTIQRKLQPNIASQKEIIGGIGIANVKRRLELHYPRRYGLEIGVKDNLFSVNMRVDLKKK